MNDHTKSPAGPCPEVPSALDHRWIETRNPEDDNWACGDCGVTNRMLRTRSRERRMAAQMPVPQMAGSKQELIKKMKSGTTPDGHEYDLYINTAAIDKVFGKEEP